MSCVKSDGDNRTEDIEKTEISHFILILKGEGNVIDTTASGMYSIIHESGSGELPQEDDTCFVEYVGYFIDGSVFDASIQHYENGIREVIYKETNLLEGFEEAIGLMKSGEKATFIIPSKLAYGSTWNDIIPPYTPLVFDINMHDIKPKAIE